MIEHRELRKIYDEYYIMQRNIIKLIRSKEILTEKGKQKYRNYKARQNKLKETLKTNNILQ